MTALGLAHFATANATVIAHETFDYPDNASIGGLAGGPGWDGSWNVNPNITTAVIRNGALVIGDGKASPLEDPSKASAISRKVESHNGDSIFLKYTFKLGAGTNADPDRLYLTLRGKGAGGGWGLLEVGTGVANGVHSTLPGARPDEKIAARVHSTSANRISHPVVLKEETPFTVIVEFSKSTSGSSTPYDTLRLWVDPTAGDYEAAQPRKLGYNQIMRSLNHVDICIDEVEAGDVFTISELKLATTWEEVVGADSIAGKKP